MTPKHEPTMPTHVTDHVGLFDRFAGWVSDLASRAPFFAFCVLLVVVWLIEGVGKVLAGGGLAAFLDDKYQLQINTTTTIITFLLVALLNNSGSRGDQATQHKLNAMADGLADLMDHHASNRSAETRRQLAEDCAELRRAVGLERYESTS